MNDATVNDAIRLGPIAIRDATPVDWDAREPRLVHLHEAPRLHLSVDKLSAVGAGR